MLNKNKIPLPDIDVKEMSIAGWKLMAVVYQPVRIFPGTLIGLYVLEIIVGSQNKHQSLHICACGGNFKMNKKDLSH